MTAKWRLLYFAKDEKLERVKADILADNRLLTEVSQKSKVKSQK